MTSKYVLYAVITYCSIITKSLQNSHCRNADISASDCNYVIYTHTLLTRDKAVERCRADGGSTFPASNDEVHISNYKFWVQYRTSFLCGSYWTFLSYNHSDGNAYLPNGDIFPLTAWKRGVPFNESYECLALQRGDIPALVPFDCSTKLNVTCITLADPCTEGSCRSGQKCVEIYKATCSHECVDIPTTTPSPTTEVSTVPTTTTTVPTTTDEPTTVTTLSTEVLTKEESTTNTTDEPTTVSTPRAEVSTNKEPTTTTTETDEFSTSTKVEPPTTTSTTVNASDSITDPPPDFPIWAIVTIGVIGAIIVVAISCIVWKGCRNESTF